jgi:hypothetical protein
VAPLTFGIAIVVQTVMTAGTPEMRLHRPDLTLPIVMFQMVIGGVVLGTWPNQAAWQMFGAFGHSVVILCGAALMIRVAIEGWRREPAPNVAWIFVLLAIGELLLLDVVRRPVTIDAALLPFDGPRADLVSLRYYIAPVFWLISALALWGQASIETEATPAAVVLISVMAATTLACFSDSRTSRSDRSWRSAVAQARDSCRNFQVTDVTVVISGGWDMYVPCSRFRLGPPPIL